MPAHHTGFETALPAVVVGGGPAGLAAALALARSGVETALVASPPAAGAPPDTRTAALFAGSIRLLVNIGLWDAVAGHAAPIAAIRLVDDTGGLLRAPETSFTARDAGLEAFGYNVPNQALVDALWEAVRAEPGLRLVAGSLLVEIKADAERARLTLGDGRQLAARLVVAADGRKSLCRAAAGIATRSWSYDQAALTCTFAHSRPHHAVSTELHRNAGPLTTVPMPGRASSLVRVERPAAAERLKSLPEAAFRDELERRLQGLLGSIGEIGPRAAFPLSGLTAEPFAQSRVALVGEAGHVIPPIGAQGLNLGLRDAATIAEIAAAAVARGDDPGGPQALDAYARARRIDVTSRVWTVDVLNRSLISGLLPVHMVRGAGIAALNLLGPLRRAVVREGLEPSGPVPALMRDDFRAPGGAAARPGDRSGDRSGDRPGDRSGDRAGDRPAASGPA